jgi:membrane-bound inhibitor of C-type lysozyme
LARLGLTVLLGAGLFAGVVPADAQSFVTYRCRDGSEFAAAFFQGDRAAHVQLDGKPITLPKRMSVTGARYSKDDITVRITKTGTTLRRGKRTTDCSAD